MPPDLTQLKIGYVPFSEDLQHPADQRRFPAYAKRRNLKLLIAKPTEAYDLVIVTQRADLTQWGKYSKGNGKVVFDMIDSYHALPGTDPKALFRGLAKFLAGEAVHLEWNYWRSLDDMCRRADSVVCVTGAQQEYARSFCENVQIILDIHSSIVRHIKEKYTAGDVFNLVWEGLPENVVLLEEIAEPLAYLDSKYRVALHIVTDLYYHRYMARFLKRPTEKRIRGLLKSAYLYEWNPQLLSAVVSACDLALVPVRLNSALECGKPENKLLLFWRMAVPAVVSATPAYRRAMEAAGLQMACCTAEDWKRTLESYLLSEDARRAAGQRGREFAEREFGEVAMLARWERVLASLFPALCSVPHPIADEKFGTKETLPFSSPISRDAPQAGSNLVDRPVWTPHFEDKAQQRLAGILVITLDLELYWGVRHHRTLEQCKESLLGGRRAIPLLLELFAEYGIHATWATVGLLFSENRAELLDSLPSRRPSYSLPHLSAYEELDSLGEDEAEDPFHYGGSLVRLISSFPHQEIASHSFSHYFASAGGQTVEQFEADLDAAVNVARRDNIALQSFVFPKNQVEESYLEVLQRKNIRAFRGYGPGGIDKPTSSLWKRGRRLLRAYGAGGYDCYGRDYVGRWKPANVASTRFLRPWSPSLGRLEELRMRSILNELRHAAEQGLICHIWWHPENFGYDTEANLLFLRQILACVEKLRRNAGLLTMSMAEVAAAVVHHTGGEPQVSEPDPAKQC